MNNLHLFLILFCCTWSSYIYGNSVIDSLHKEALNLCSKHQYEAAFKIFDKNLTLQKEDKTKGKEFLARTYRNAGSCLLKLHRLQKAEEYLNKAIDEYLLILKKETSPINCNRLGICFENRARVMMYKGEFEKAIYDAKEAAIWFNKINNKVNEIRILCLFADIYHDTKNFDIAKEKCFEALKKSWEVEDFSHKLLSDIYHTLALIYHSEKKYPERAAEYYLKSMEYMEDSVDLGKTLNNLALVYLESRDFSKSQGYLNQTMRIKQQIQNHSAYDFSYAGPYENFGDLEVAKQNPESALKHYQKSVINLTDNFRDTDIFQSPKPDKSLYIYSHIKLVRVLDLKAQAALKVHEKTKENRYLHLAQQTYDYAFTVQSQLQQQLFSERAKLLHNKEAIAFKERAIAVAWQLYQKTNDPQYAETAFRYMEMSKANVLLEEIKKKEALGFSGISDALLNSRYDLVGKRNQLQKRIHEADNPSPEWNGQIIQIDQQLQNIDRQIERDYPNYYAAMQEFQPIDLQQLRNEILDNSSALAEYFLTDEFLYSVYIDKNDIRFYRTKLTNNLPQQITVLLDNRQYTTGSQLKAFTQVNHDLYQQIFQSLQISENINKLIIIPDKELSYLPFEMLISTPKTQQLDYLIHDYTFSYAYSATILGKQQNHLKTNTELLAMAPVFSGKAGKELSGSQANTTFISDLYKGKSLFHEQASKRNFITQAPNHNILHLSTHAQAGITEPFIEFHQDTLYLKDLYAIRLDAELAVLSACETGLGKQEKGEGVMSLSRGFTYAGVPSLVTSLWAVNENSTSQIMQDFYKNLKQGASKDEALRQAKRTYIKAHPDQAPYYWAGFIQIGQTDPLPTSSPKLFWMFGGIFLLISLLIWRK